MKTITDKFLDELTSHRFRRSHEFYSAQVEEYDYSLV